MARLLKKRLLQKRKQALREHALMHPDAYNALENKIGAAAAEFQNKLTGKNCIASTMVLDADTGYVISLCNLNPKTAESLEVYSNMIAASIIHQAMDFGISTDKVLGDIASALGETEQLLGIGD